MIYCLKQNLDIILAPIQVCKLSRLIFNSLSWKLSVVITKTSTATSDCDDGEMLCCTVRCWLNWIHALSWPLDHFGSLIKHLVFIDWELISHSFNNSRVVIVIYLSVFKLIRIINSLPLLLLRKNTKRFRFTAQQIQRFVC